MIKRSLGRDKKQKSDYYQFLKDNHQYKSLIVVLYEDYYQLLMGLSYTITDNIEEARDTASAVFELLIFSLDNIHLPTVTAWLFRVTKHKSIDILRKRKIKSSHNPYLDFGNTSYDYEPDFIAHEEKIEYENNIIKIIGFLSQMKREQKECLCMHYLERKSYKEISAEKNYPVKSVKSKIQNGIRMMRKFLKNNNTQYYARRKARKLS